MEQELRGHQSGRVLRRVGDVVFRHPRRHGHDRNQAERRDGRAQSLRSRRLQITRRLLPGADSGRKAIGRRNRRYGGESGDRGRAVRFLRLGRHIALVLNDGNTPVNSLERGTGSYGNWPKTGTQWVQYDWDRPISTRRVEIYWWDDHQGVRLPKTCRLLYWNGEKFVPVAHPSGLGTAGDRFNVTTFDEVQTTRLRLEIDGKGDFSTGLLEWRVCDSGKSPTFPRS